MAHTYSKDVRYRTHGDQRGRRAGSEVVLFGVDWGSCRARHTSRESCSGPARQCDDASHSLRKISSRSSLVRSTNEHHVNWTYRMTFLYYLRSVELPLACGLSSSLKKISTNEQESCLHIDGKHIQAFQASNFSFGGAGLAANRFTATKETTV